MDRPATPPKDYDQSSLGNESTERRRVAAVNQQQVGQPMQAYDSEQQSSQCTFAPFAVFGNQDMMMSPMEGPSSGGSQMQLMPYVAPQPPVLFNTPYYDMYGGQQQFLSPPPPPMFMPPPIPMMPPPHPYMLMDKKTLRKQLVKDHKLRVKGEKEKHKAMKKPNMCMELCCKGHAIVLWVVVGIIVTGVIVGIVLGLIFAQ